ncbi:MAG: hypothetical protein E6672_03255 [Negativicoccus succinicivorans]|nr:hypothetical protein [Negativicoccus succinicivorans]MDU3214852.1 hypothetical protein [Negativicoccus succinicivorans]
MTPIEGKIILYQTQNGNQSVSVLYKDDFRILGLAIIKQGLIK